MLWRSPVRTCTTLAFLLLAAAAPAQNDEIDFDALLRSREKLAQLEVRHRISWWQGRVASYELLLRGDGTAAIRTWSRGEIRKNLRLKCSGAFSPEEMEQIVARFATWDVARLHDNVAPGTIFIGEPDGDMHYLQVTFGNTAIKKSFWVEGLDKPKKPAHPALIDLSNYIWEVARKTKYKCRLSDSDTQPEPDLHP